MGVSQEPELFWTFHCHCLFYVLKINPQTDIFHETVLSFFVVVSLLCYRGKHIMYHTSPP